MSGSVARGLTLEQYSKAKKLPLEFLRKLGLTNLSYQSAPAVKIPYRGTDGGEISVRFRTALGGADRFRWKSGSKAIPYGLWRLAEAREKGHLALVEGETDSQTLWFGGEPALGLPGAATWRDEHAELLDGIERVYAVIEPDQGGETLLQKLAESPIRDRVLLVRLNGFKDVSEAHVAGRLREVWAEALGSAEPLRDHLERERKLERDKAWVRCEELARSPRILDRFAVELKRAGVVGEDRTAKLLYLVVTSRLLDTPVSAVVKGPSSAGKSFITAQVIRFFPESATYELTAMSDRALAYSDEPLKHRHLVVYESAGLESDVASYLVRSLLSEGRLRYETVEKSPSGEMAARVIEREGPTGLIVTTTRVSLHPENETRMLSITVSDAPEQTRAILRKLAEEDAEPPNLGVWIALQEWLGLGEHQVTIPYAADLAEIIPSEATRLRRDFGALLALIRVHAILQQASRERDDKKRIVATPEDYGAVRHLVLDLMSEGVELSVSEPVRETVEAVERLVPDHPDGVVVRALVSALRIDRSAVYRRVKRAGDYLRNLEDKKGKPMRLKLGGEPLPDRQEILPTPEALAERCTVARPTGGVTTPPSPPEPERRRGLL